MVRTVDLRVERTLAQLQSRRSAEEAVFKAGRWFQAQLGDEGAKRWCKQNGVTRSVSEGLNTAGGALVPDDITDTIIALRDRRGVFRGSASVLPMKGDTKSAPRRTGGLTASFTAEGVALSESSLTFDSIGLVAKKLTTSCKISAELSEDAAPDVGAYFVTEAAYAFASKEDDCGFNGDGTSTYGGIRGLTKLLIDGSHNAGKVTASSGHNTFALLDNTDLTSLMAALPSYALPGAKWFVSNFGYATTFCRLAASAGGIVTTQVNGVTVPSFLGFPVQITPVLPQVGSSLAGSIMITFGDLSMAATLGDRRQATVNFTTERFIDTDQIGVFGSERVDIVVHDLGDNTTAGPIVGLVGG